MLIVYAYVLEAAMDAAFTGDKARACALAGAIAALDATLLLPRCLRLRGRPLGYVHIAAWL